MIDLKIQHPADPVVLLAGRLLSEIQAAGLGSITARECIMGGIGWGIALAMASPEYAQALIADRPVERRLQLREQLRAFIADHPITNQDVPPWP